MCYVVDNKKCTGCLSCVPECEVDAIIELPYREVFILCDYCTDCGHCAVICPEGAISEG